MRRLWAIAVAVVCLAGLSGAVSAQAPKAQQAPKKKSPEKLFAKRDTNGDGKLTLEEYIGKKSGNSSARVEYFRILDQDSDGSLTLAEFKDRSKMKKGAEQES